MINKYAMLMRGIETNEHGSKKQIEVDINKGQSINNFYKVFNIYLC